MTYDSYRIAEVFDRSASSCDTVIPCFTELGARLVEFASRRLLDVGRREMFAELAALKTTAGIPMLQGAAFVAADTPAG